MGKRNAQLSLLMGASAAAGLLMLGACNDFLTGQDGEPSGPLKVTKLTLRDQGRSRPSGDQVVTDTSVPADCSADAVKDLPKCNADPFGDKYGVIKSPPNPDSAAVLRVIFNKVPLNLDGVTLEPVPAEGLPSADMPLKLSDPSVITLTCQNCSTDGVNMGVPPTFNSLHLTGTDLSPDPAQYAYGPALQMEVLLTCPAPTTPPVAPTKCQLAGPSYVADPFRALEPGATYSVVLKPGLQGRLANGVDNVLLDDSAKALLTFTTEPFKLLGFGIGDGDVGDQAVEGAKEIFGDGSAAKPYKIGKYFSKTDPVTGEITEERVDPTLDNEGAVVLPLNAAADEQVFTAQTASATVVVNGGAAMSVPVIVSNATGAPTMCKYGKRRTLYIAPVAGSWLTMPEANAVVTITLRGSEVRDLSQLPGHPATKGIHVLAKDVVFQATLLSASDPDYAGVAADEVVPPSGC